MNFLGGTLVSCALACVAAAAIAATAGPADKPVAGAPATSTAVAKAAKVLIVTGDDYPGHKWQQTAPVLAEAIRKDPRLDVKVVEDPNVLASPSLKDYDAVVLHWMNWNKPDPGEAARENLRKFVDGGKGLVLVHFACGAFQGWPEFRKIAGRSYDPNLRAHDPHGRFRVEIIDANHAITQGLKSFETTDELYTCLAGDGPIQVLATAKSKVDGKDYPMVFVLTYGKGRVFHSPLGHDVKAFGEEVGELFRRGSAWAAGLAPVPKDK
jgi:type 1 glutamine amidotransferase